MSDKQDNVLSLSSLRPDLVWQCRCGGQLFYILNDGYVRCYSCGLIPAELEAVNEDNKLRIMKLSE